MLKGELLWPEGERGFYQEVLDHGYVELENWSHHRRPEWNAETFQAMDLSVANGARVSFGKRVGAMSPAEVGLIRSLMKDHHGSPFEHASFTFRVRCPLFVMREWHRHRTASISEASARYTIVPDLFYVPGVEDMRMQVGKANAYTFEPMEAADAEHFRREMRGQNQMAFELYQRLLEKSVAKEVARTVLPVSMYSEMLWTVNARNLMGFLQLRNAEPAQREIRAYAEIMEAMFAIVMPTTAAAFSEYGRVKP